MGRLKTSSKKKKNRCSVTDLKSIEKNSQSLKFSQSISTRSLGEYKKKFIFIKIILDNKGNASP